MADLKRVKARIREIAEGNRKNITIDDIRWVVNHLEQNGYSTKESGSGHIVFRVGNKDTTRRFGVCDHNRGSRHIKRCYVDDFIDVMIDLDLYE